MIENFGIHFGCNTRVGGLYVLRQVVSISSNGVGDIAITARHTI